MRTTLAVIATSLTATVAFGQSLNEIRTQQTGIDTQIYAEIAGTSSASLNGLSLLVIGGDDNALPPGQNGYIESVISLDGKAVPASGFFVMAEPSYTLTTPNLVASLGFQTDNNKTFMLVRNFAGIVGDDIDLNDDGTIDNALWTEVLDSVALLSGLTADGTVGDFVYSTKNCGPDGGAFVSHAKKCPTTGAWQVGFADTTAGGDTPGAANPACTTGGFVQLNEIRGDQVGTDNDEYVEIVGTPGTSLSDLTYLVIGDGTSAQLSGVVECLIPLTGQTIPANGVFLITLKNTGGQDGIVFGKTGDLQTDKLILENSDHVTHMLVRGYTGQATTGQDLDANNDGVLDTKPWTTVADSVALVKVASSGPVKDPYNTGTSGEFTYQVTNGDGTLTPQIGPDGSTQFVPGHIYRCSPQGSWKIGYFDPVGAGSNNKDTPKAVNPECASCGDPASGSSYVVHGAGGSKEGTCCTIVCAFSPDCCNIAWDANCVNSALANCLTGGNAPVLKLSEMRLRDPDNVVNNIDQNEYLEITGAPNTLLNGVSVVVLNNYGVNAQSQPNTGVIRTALKLDGLRIPSSGRFLITEQTFGLAATSDFNCGGGLVFDNSGSLSVFLAWNFYGQAYDDLDTNDDGILDLVRWQSNIDEVTVVGDTGAVYANTNVGPSSGILPAQVYRCAETGVWTIGPGSITTGYDTPGAVNASCSLPRVFSCGDADAGDCFQPHNNAHCFNRACCETVCSVVPDCCSVIWDDACSTAAGTLTACGGGNAPVVISEARMDQDQNSFTPSTGDDLDEYVELSGSAGTSLDGLTLIVIGDGSGTTVKSGVVECVVALDGMVIMPTGKFLITVKNTATGTAARDGTVFNGYDASTGLTPAVGDLQTAALILENSDNVTFMLVQGFSGALNDDLDTNDDGVLDTTPWTSKLDAVSVVTSIRSAPSSSQEWWYAPRIGPNSAGSAYQIYRCSPTGYWVNGNRYFLDAATRTDTPGVDNTACPNVGPACFGDIDLSGVVDNGDIAFALLDFGACPGCQSDLDGSGETDFGDVALILLSTGACQ
jgi:hypothetical protein